MTTVASRMTALYSEISFRSRGAQHRLLKVSILDLTNGSTQGCVNFSRGAAAPWGSSPVHR